MFLLSINEAPPQFQTKDRYLVLEAGAKYPQTILRHQNHSAGSVAALLLRPTHYCNKGEEISGLGSCFSIFRQITPGLSHHPDWGTFCFSPARALKLILSLLSFIIYNLLVLFVTTIVNYNCHIRFTKLTCIITTQLKET